MTKTTQDIKDHDEAVEFLRWATNAENQAGLAARNSPLPVAPGSAKAITDPGLRWAAEPIASRRLWVPMKACRPPGDGATPNVDSHQAAPASSEAAATTRPSWDWYAPMSAEPLTTRAKPR